MSIETKEKWKSRISGAMFTLILSLGMFVYYEAQSEGAYKQKVDAQQADIRELRSDVSYLKEHFARSETKVDYLISRVESKWGK